MKKQFILSVMLLVIMVLSSCHNQNQNQKHNNSADDIFSKFETRFMDAYWRNYPSASIMVGYGKYYENLVIPDSSSFASNIIFSKQWMDSLNIIDLTSLNNNNKISFKIIRNQLESDVWYQSVFRPQEWDPSQFNLSAECDYIINQPYASLDSRLKILSAHIRHADEFYKAALKSIKKPTRELTEMAILQNQGGLDVFGKQFEDSVKASHLGTSEKKDLEQNIKECLISMNGYITALKRILADKKTDFRDFRIGKDMYAAKFRYDLVVDLSPDQLYEKAKEAKEAYFHKMFGIADNLWAKYYKTQAKPKDTLEMVQLVLDKIQLQHAKPQNFFDTLTNQVNRMKKFILAKGLFDFDTTLNPILVRIMPSYERGFSIASAEFSPPYQKKGPTFYNIDDLTIYPPEKAESALREYNDFSSQLLSIHEAMPGHCLQGIYNNRKSPDIVRAVFGNGAMIEGWAVYTESMMLENGWANFAPEMELVHDKLKMREIGNVIIDNEIQCLGKSKEDIHKFLVKDCFQTMAQADEKYHRATVSQVQLCSYFAGSVAIGELRDEYHKKLRDKFNLREFHEKFLSFGSSPVKYIREIMLQ
jgi:uncharacterized protein (DUF885 family)